MKRRFVNERRGSKAIGRKFAFNLTLLSVLSASLYFGESFWNMVIVFAVAGTIALSCLAGWLVYSDRKGAAEILSKIPRQPAAPARTPPKPDHSGPPLPHGLINELDWSRFEELCVLYFKAAGYRVSWKRLGPDSGIDITMTRSEGEHRIKYIVQCKAWSNKPVGVRYIRELLGVKVSATADKALFIATSGYTADARLFARDNDITLLTSQDMATLIQKLPFEHQQRIASKILAGDYWTPRCPNCGTPLVKRTARNAQGNKRPFWGCPSFPRCRYTMAMKSSELRRL